MTAEQVMAYDYFCVNLVAGGLSGGFARLCVAPLDVVKIRFQVQVDPNVKHTQYRPNYHYKSISHAFSTICKQEGIIALWHGNLLAEAMWISFASVQFSSYSLYKYSTKFLLPEKYSPLSSFLCGGLAGLTATLTVYPLDLLRTRFAAQSLPVVYPTIKSAVLSIYRSQGIYGFYYGICPSLWQLIPYAAMQFFIYDSLKQRAAEISNTTIGPALAGLVAGSFSKMIVLPFDVVKKRLQIHGLNLYRQGKSPGRCPSLLKTMYEIFTREGPKAFFKGAVPSVLKASGQTAIVFSIYENSKTIICNLFNVPQPSSQTPPRTTTTSTSQSSKSIQ